MPKQGYLTPSGIKLMCTGSRSSDEFGKTARKYAMEIALGRLGVEVPDNSGGWAIEWGNEWEFAAIEAYEKATFSEVHSKQTFQMHPDFEWVGGTPDGLVSEDGGMDAKCPYVMTNHAFNLIENMQLDDYALQFHGYMWITERAWWDFVSYDPRFEGENQDLGLHIHRLERDEEKIQMINEKYQRFEEIIQEYVERLSEQKLNRVVA